jgi:hypothetical protein
MATTNVPQHAPMIAAGQKTLSRSIPRIAGSGSWKYPSTGPATASKNPATAPIAKSMNHRVTFLNLMRIIGSRNGDAASVEGFGRAK